MDELQKAKLLKESINKIIDRLGLTSKWKDITGKVFDEFVKDGLEYNTDNFNKLRDKIRKNLTDDSRKNLQFLEKLKSSLEETDYISNLCHSYMNKFRNNEFFIPENDIKEIREKANNGHKLAQRTLGEYYLSGGNFGIPNLIESHSYCRKAFEQYDWMSAYYLAKIYSDNPFNNPNIAHSYYEYALLFYFEGKNSSEYIPLRGKMKLSDYIIEKGRSILEVLNYLANDSVLLKVRHLSDDEKLPYLIKETKLSEFNYLIDKLSELYCSDSSIRKVFRHLLANYSLYKEDEDLFIVSVFGSICGEVSALYRLANSFRDGKGTQSDLTLAVICYTGLVIWGRNTEWAILAMRELAQIYQELEKKDHLGQQSEIFVLLKEVLQK